MGLAFAALILGAVLGAIAGWAMAGRGTSKEVLLKPVLCSHGNYCDGIRDPRCMGGNCTQHCASVLGCNERCLDAWAKTDAAFELTRKALEKTRR